MSDHFEIHESDKFALGNFYLVRPKDKQWNDFPATFLPFNFLKILDKVKSFQVNDDDIFLTGFPRSGTTLIGEMVWLIANQFDFDKAASLVTDDRVVGLE